LTIVFKLIKNIEKKLQMFPDNKKVDKASQRHQIVPLSIGLGALYWIIDSFVDSFIFNEGTFTTLLFHPPLPEIWMRLFTMGILVFLGVFTNHIIFKHTQTGDALSESEKRYRTLAEAAQDMIFIVDRNDFVQYVNNIAAKQFGCKPEELIGRKRGELFPEEVSSRQRQSLQKVFETGEALYTENRIVFPNKELWIGASLVPVKDDTGKVISVTGVSRDITKRMLREKEIKANNALLEAITRTQSQFIVDTEPTVIFNNILESLLSLTKSEYGFIGEILFTAEGKPYLKTHAITNIAWNEESRSFYEKNAPNMKFYNLKTLFGEVMITGKPVISNNPSTDPRRGGLPEGHPSLDCFLGIPFYYGSNMVGMVGIANSPDSYNEKTIEYLQPLLITCGNIIEAYRNNQRRKQAEGALRESEERYRMLFHRSPLGVFHYDKELRITECNDRFTEIAHLSREKIEGLDLRILNDKELVLILLMVLEGREGTYEGVCALTSGGEETWVSLHAAPLFDQQGNIKSGIGIVEDITEQKKSEDEVKKILRQQEAILNNIPDIAWLKNKEGRFIAVNEPFGRACGVKPSDLVGKTDFDIWPLELAERYIADDREVMTSGKRKNVEEPLADKEDKIAWIETIKTPIYNEKGEVIGTSGIARDITERKKMEEKLFQITHDWEDTFNSITDMVTVHDKDFNIIHANKAAEKILHLPILNITPQKCYRFYHGTDRPPEGCPSCDCLNTGTASTTELYEPHLEKFIEITAIPRFDSSNNVAGLIHIVRDITERKKLEDQLRQSQKMEAIGQLAGGIAHDFNNILTAIIGYANILKLKLKDDPVKINIDQILVSSEKGALLTQSLLAFSRQQVSRPETVYINDIIKNMEKLLLRVIGENMELKTELTGDLIVMADSIQIDQVLINLCTNARDAMPHGGRLIIETKKAGPSAVAFLKEERSLLKLTGNDADYSGEFAELSVSDTGIGMDEKIRERIFEPFFTTKDFGKGTGLGLSIVYGIIKQHNGYIVCESEPGKGTTFKIYLPIIKADVVKIEPEEIPDTINTAYTILLAEDEFVVRKLTKQVLEEFGYQVMEAVDGEDAVNKFVDNKDTIDLLIFDIIMPKMSGQEAYDKIMKITPGIKIILTSGYPADFINKDAIIKEGINFMAKPISPARLLKKVREVLIT
jgi:PAS domain S-box-containing protein